MRAAIAAVAAALTLVAAGCGSEAGVGAAPDAAAVLKPGAVVYWEAVTDPESDQWNQVEELLRRFPDGDDWIAELKREVETGETELSWERDIRPALGERTAVAVYAESRADVGVVGLTNPDDPQKTIDLAERLNAEEDDPAERMVVRRVGEWVAVSNKEASIDAALKAEGGEALSDAQAFSDAVEQLPDDALSRAYVDPAAAVRVLGNLALDESSFDLSALGLDELDFAVAWAKARSDGAELGSAVQGAGAEKLLGTGEPYTSALLEHAPATAFAFYSIRGEGAGEDLEALRDNPLYGMALREVERELGVTLEQVVALFDGEVALYAAPGVPFPELTLILDAADPAEARDSVERLLRGLTTRSGGEVTEDGDVTTAVLEGFTLNLGRVGDAVALSTTKRIFGDDRGDKLADSDRFEDALEAAGVPDEYTGLAYVDLAEAAELALGYVRASEEDVPPEVSRNLEPLKALVAYGERDGDLASSLVFVNID